MPLHARRSQRTTNPNVRGFESLLHELLQSNHECNWETSFAKLKLETFFDTHFRAKYGFCFTAFIAFIINACRMFWVISFKAFCTVCQVFLPKFLFAAYRADCNGYSYSTSLWELWRRQPTILCSVNDAPVLSWLLSPNGTLYESPPRLFICFASNEYSGSFLLQVATTVEQKPKYFSVWASFLNHLETFTFVHELPGYQQLWVILSVNLVWS